MELPLPPRGSHPLCSSDSGLQSLTSQFISVSRQHSEREPACCVPRSPRPALGQTTGPSPPRREGTVRGLRFPRGHPVRPQGEPRGWGAPVAPLCHQTVPPRGHPVRPQGEPGGWGAPAASLLCQKLPGVAVCPGPQAAGEGPLPGSPRAQPPLPCLLLALFTLYPSDVCGASASGRHGCRFLDVCRLRFQAAFPPGSPSYFLRPCLPSRAWRGSTGIVTSGARLCCHPVPRVVDAAPPACKLPLSTSACNQPF